MKLRKSLLACALALAPTAANAYHIMIDPGHGGVDTGAVRGIAKEADLVLKVAKELKHMLEPQFQVSMTRNSDTNLSLPERVKKAEAAQADLFVSLHANAAGDSRARGVEFFFQNSLPPDEESMYLASVENQNFSEASTEIISAEPSKKSDVAAILEDLKRQHRIDSSLRLTQSLSQIWEQDSGAAHKAVIKQAPFYVISKTNMPSVLIELGFITHPQEVKKLMSSQYQSQLAQKIYKALVSYTEKVDKERAVRQSAQ